jgi:hypothetical protein
MSDRFLPAPLSATINSAVVTLGGHTLPTHTFVNAMPEYAGNQMYCHATSDGTILTILIDDQEEPITPTPDKDATVVAITVNFNETPTPEQWDVTGITYTGGTPVVVGMRLDANWDNATLSIGDPPAGSTSANLGYVLVKGGSGDDVHFDVYWLSNVALIDATDLSAATIIPDGGGGMAGPFGIALP